MEAIEKTPQNAIAQAENLVDGKKGFDWRENFVVRVILLAAVLFGVSYLVDEIIAPKYSNFAGFAAFLFVWGYLLEKVLVVSKWGATKAALVLVAIYIFSHVEVWQLLYGWAWFAWQLLKMWLGFM